MSLLFPRLLAVLAALALADSAWAARFLFDATKAETAGNADWVISENAAGVPTRFPSPPAAGITSDTPESYWTGALSSWGVALVLRGHRVETLPSGSRLTYLDSSNPQDLSGYDVFVVCEPNILFTAAEKTALISWVRDGGALFLIADHSGSDRNNDGADSPRIWNDLFLNNGVQADPFGLAFNLDSRSAVMTDVESSPDNPLTHGAEGAVTQLRYSSGATMTLHPAANSSVRGAVWFTATPADSSAVCAWGTFGAGRFVAVGDSSPFDDGTGHPSDTLYFGWTDLGGNHSRLILNASAWLAAASAMADPDGDGIPNFLERAFALDPLAPSLAAALPQGVPLRRQFALAFAVAKAQSADLRWTVETSADLATWQAGATYSVSDAGVLLRDDNTLTSQVGVTDQGASFLVTEGAPSPARFLRLRVTSVR